MAKLVSGHRLAWWITLVVILLTMAPAFAASERMVLLAPSKSGIYTEFYEAFKSSWASLCKQKQNRPLDVCKEAPLIQLETEPDNTISNLMTIALGSQSGEKLAAVHSDSPRYFTLVPATGFRRYVSTGLQVSSKRVGSTYIDQPEERQFALVKALFPDKKRIGILLGKRQAGRKSELVKLAKKSGLQLTIESVETSSDVGPSLKALIDQIDVLLAIPDRLVYNRGTIVNLLLTSYRHKIPVVGYSEGLVNAGATASVYTAVEQLANATATDLMTYFRTQRFPAPHHADDFTVKINRDVARSLGLRPPDDSELKTMIRGEP